MKKIYVQINLTKEQVNQLTDLYKWAVGNWNKESKMEVNHFVYLLGCHLEEMLEKLEERVARKKKTTTLAFSKTEAAAFGIIWNKTPIEYLPLANVVVLDIIAAIHQQSLKDNDDSG